MRPLAIGVLSLLGAAALACQASPPGGAATSAPVVESGRPLPSPPQHIIVLLEENRSLNAIAGNRHLPNFTKLISEGALFTNSHAVAHPSLPNYFALFTGVTNTDGDHCSDERIDPLGDLPVPAGLSALMPNLGSALVSRGFTFTGYAEDLPSVGYVGCYGRGGSLTSAYYKRHVPWAFFTVAGHPGAKLADLHHYLLDDGANEPWSAFPAAPHYETLPTVAMVTPNLRHDMHGWFAERVSADLEEDADAWVGRNIMPLADWARDPKNHALLIVTWDESERSSPANQIPTILVGGMVRPGTYGQYITHYSVLATIEDFYHLGRLGKSAGATPIEACWAQ